jgi:hypothetical protein
MLISVGFFLILLGESVISASCESIVVDTHPVVVERGTVTNVRFVVYNFSDESFMVDYAYAYDYAPGTITELVYYDDLIRERSKGMLQLTVHTLKNANFKKANGYVKLRGRFTSGEECGYADVGGKKSFDITLRNYIEFADNKESIKTLGCNAVELRVVKSKNVRFGRPQRIYLYIINYSGKRLNVWVQGVGAVTDIGLFSIPDNTETTKYLHVVANDRNAWVNYTLDIEGCEPRVVRTMLNVFEPPERKPVKLSHGIIYYDTKVGVEIILENPNDFNVNGVLDLNVPEEWDKNAPVSVEIPAKGKTRIVVELSPKEAKETEGTIIFSYNGNVVKKSILLIPEKEQRPLLSNVFAGFIGLVTTVGNNIFLLLIMLGALILLLVAYQNLHVPEHIKKQPWVTGKRF